MIFIQLTVTFYVFIAIIIMVFKGFTMPPDNNYMDKVRHRALVWPLECLFIIRRYLIGCRLKWVLNVNRAFKNGHKDVDIDIDEVVFYVKDEDKNKSIFNEVTNVEGGLNVQKD